MVFLLGLSIRYLINIEWDSEGLCTCPSPLPSPSKFWPWLSSVTHVAHNNSLHAFNLCLPKELRRLWREAASFSLSNNIHLLLSGSLWRMKWGTVHNYTPQIHQDCLSQQGHGHSLTASFVSWGAAVGQTTKCSSQNSSLMAPPD